MLASTNTQLHIYSYKTRTLPLRGAQRLQTRGSQNRQRVLYTKKNTSVWNKGKQIHRARKGLQLFYNGRKHLSLSFYVLPLRYWWRQDTESDGESEYFPTLQRKLSCPFYQTFQTSQTSAQSQSCDRPHSKFQPTQQMGGVARIIYHHSPHNQTEQDYRWPLLQQDAHMQHTGKCLIF